MPRAMFVKKILACGINFDHSNYKILNSFLSSRSGGKGDAITQIRNFNSSQLISNNQQVITMIGDGATDLEACPPANFFIGYGGNIIRESVRDRAQYYVTDFTQLM